MASAPPQITDPVKATTLPPSTVASRGKAAGGDPVTEAGFSYRWRRLPTGAGGWVTGLVVHPSAPDVRYVRTDVGGAYRWDTSASQWVQLIRASNVDSITTDRDDYVVESLAVAPSDAKTLYLTVGNDETPPKDQPFPRSGRVMRSSDGGNTWKVSDKAFFVAGNGEQRQLSERIAVDPANARRLFVGTRADGLWLSVDGGASWAAVAGVPAGRVKQAGETPAGVTFVAFDPAGGAAGERTNRVFAGVAGEGVFRSDDAGATWRLIAGVRNTAVIVQEGQVAGPSLIVAFNTTDQAKAAVHLYTIATDTWKEITPPGASLRWAAALDPTNPNRIVVADEAVRTNSFYLSLDGGRSWHKPKVKTSSPGIPWIERSNPGAYMPVGRLVWDPQKAGRLWFAEGIGVWRGGNV